MCVIEDEETLVDVLDTAGQEEFRQVEEFAILCGPRADFHRFFLFLFLFFFPLFSFIVFFFLSFFLVGYYSWARAPFVYEQCNARALHARRGGISSRVLGHGTRFV
jgi:hypothetical protein